MTKREVERELAGVMTENWELEELRSLCAMGERALEHKRPRQQLKALAKLIKVYTRVLGELGVGREPYLGVALSVRHRLLAVSKPMVFRVQPFLPDVLPDVHELAMQVVGRRVAEECRSRADR